MPRKASAVTVLGLSHCVLSNSSYKNKGIETINGQNHLLRMSPMMPKIETKMGGIKKPVNLFDQGNN